jgi:hypothetical protein
VEDRPGDAVRRDAHPAWRPGQTVAGRYRLDEHRPADLPGSERWDATDQILARRVTLTLLTGPRTGAAVDGARRAALVVDARLARILDVGTADGTGYVVTEPAEGRTLASLVATAPLSPDQARAVVGEAAGALEAARRRGVHHLALRPAAIRITSAGRVVLDGLAVDGELLGTTGGGAHATSRTDTVGLVRLLYTALTGRWPVAPDAETTAGDVPSFAEWSAAPRATTPTPSPLADLDTGLPLAPEADGAPVPPAEIVPGLPADLDTLCTVTLGPHDDGPHSPGELVRELEPWRAVRADAIFQAADAGRWSPVGGAGGGAVGAAAGAAVAAAAVAGVAAAGEAGAAGSAVIGSSGAAGAGAAAGTVAGAAGSAALGAAAGGVAGATSGAAGAAAAGIGSATATGAAASTPSRPTRPTRTPVAARTAPVGTPRVEPPTGPSAPPTPAEAPTPRAESPATTDEPTPAPAADPAAAAGTTPATAQIPAVTGPTTAAALPEASPGAAPAAGTVDPAPRTTRDRAAAHAGHRGGPRRAGDPRRPGHGHLGRAARRRRHPRAPARRRHGAGTSSAARGGSGSNRHGSGRAGTSRTRSTDRCGTGGTGRRIVDGTRRHPDHRRPRARRRARDAAHAVHRRARARRAGAPDRPSDGKRPDDRPPQHPDPRRRGHHRPVRDRPHHPRAPVGALGLRPGRRTGQPPTGHPAARDACARLVPAGGRHARGTGAHLDARHARRPRGAPDRPAGGSTRRRSPGGPAADRAAARRTADRPPGHRATDPRAAARPGPGRPLGAALRRRGPAPQRRSAPARPDPLGARRRGPGGRRGRRDRDRQRPGPVA